MTKPKSLRELVVYLEQESPRVTIIGIHGEIDQCEFLRASPGGFHFVEVDSEKEHFLPMNCRLTDAASQAEAGMEFSENGFSLTKFNRTVRVEYRGRSIEPGTLII
jgi:hypothetical protein